VKENHHNTKEFSTTINPFTITAIFYMTIAIVTSIFSFLAISDLYFLRGISWIRVHVITLGVITQFLYGYLPQIKNQTEKSNWGLWITLNIGILTFLTGRTYQISSLILSGGIIIFVATLILYYILLTNGEPISLSSGKLYYLSGITYFLLGIILGTGIWLGWAEGLGIGNILEVHIHANNWGLLSFIFAGIFLDRYEDWFHIQLARKSTFRLIYFLLLAGAFGLIVGPWIGSEVFIVSGLIIHLIGTSLILYNIIKPTIGNNSLKKQGLQLSTPYLWFLAPVFISPLVLLKIPGIPGRIIEQRAPEALIFGWALPILIFILLNRKQQQESRGSPISLIMLHLGALSIWIGIFSTDLLYGIGYLFFAISLVPVVITMIQEQIAH